MSLIRNRINDVRFQPASGTLQFQNQSATALNRYPLIFSFLQRTIGAAAAPTILSFGCSTGEEVQTLRNCFPRATIKGIDVNPLNIAVCRERMGDDPGLSFDVADSVAAEPDSAYDVICCFAVLRRSGLGARDSCRPDICFEDFERCITGFARCLRVGGLLALRHTSFRFADTAASQQFDTLLVRSAASKEPVMFGRDNRRLYGIAEEPLAFRKRR